MSNDENSQLIELESKLEDALELQSKKCKSLDDYVELSFSFRFDKYSIIPLQIKDEISTLLKILEFNKPQTILEIGTSNGGSLYLFCKVATSDATIISIDLSDGEFGGELYPNWKIPFYQSFKEPNQKLYLIRENSHDQKAINLTKNFLQEKKFDLIFIDGDHTYEGVKKDFEMYSSLLNEDGIIVFHDINKTIKENVGVPKLWNEIKSNHPSIEIIDVNGADNYGLGIIFSSELSPKYVNALQAVSKLKEKQISMLNRKLRHSEEELENQTPMVALLNIYSNRPDLQNLFPEVKNYDFRNLLNWAVNTDSNNIGSIYEKNIISKNKKSYKQELEKRLPLLQQQETISKLEEEKKQQQTTISKLKKEHQNIKEEILEINSKKEEFETDLGHAHKVIQKITHEHHLLSNELTEIKSGLTWSIFSKTQKTLSKLFPSNTKRYAFVYLPKQYFIYSRQYGIKSATQLSLNLIKQKRFSLFALGTNLQNQNTTWKNLQNFDDIQINSIRKKIANFKIKPKISIILPVYDVEKKWLRRAIDSVREQLYENWELCIVDDASTKPHIKFVLNEFANKDSRIKVKFLENNQNISGASNEALSMVSGDYVGLLDHDDEIYSDALFEVAKAINEHSNMDIIYSDENHVNPQGERIDPFFKPDYSPDLLFCCHYMVHFIVYRTSLLKQLGGFRKGFEGSQDYDLILRAVEKTTKIHHISKPLYGWRNIPTSTAVNIGAKKYAPIAAKKALTEALERRKIDAIPEYMPEIGYFRLKYKILSNPLVSIIIVTHDNPKLLLKLLSSIEKKTTYQNYELIIIDRKSETKEALEFFKTINKNVIRYDNELNISDVYNFAAKNTKGDYLLFMNDDMEIISPDWIESMLGPCQRKEVGIVGAQLIYPKAINYRKQISNETIQHAGVVLGIGGIAGHAFRHINYLQNGYFGFNKTIRNYSAVTGACMLVKKDVFNQVHGYDPLFNVAYGDVDFCLRVRQAGYLVVYTPFAKIYHYESATREILNPPEDAYNFVERWQNDLIKGDPYYNKNLSLLREDFSLSFWGKTTDETPMAILLEIYATRLDLQKNFPEVANGQYSSLLKWAISYGSLGSKHGIPPDPSQHMLKLYQDWYKKKLESKRKSANHVQMAR